MIISDHFIIRLTFHGQIIIIFFYSMYNLIRFLIENIGHDFFPLRIFDEKREREKKRERE